MFSINKLKAVSSPAGGSNDLTKLIMDEQWDQAVLRCQSHPAEASAWSSRPGFFEGVKASDVLPIHQACALRPPPEIIDALYHAHPDGLRSKESAYRRRPLHIACRSGASPDAVRRLLHHYSDAASTDDALGRLPLHYALSNGADPTIVETLLEACPGGARAADKRGWLPLHIACNVGASMYVIRELVESYPESVVMATNKGSIPRKCCKMAVYPHKAEVVALLEEREAEYHAGRRVAASPRRNSIRTIV